MKQGLANYEKGAPWIPKWVFSFWPGVKISRITSVPPGEIGTSGTWIFLNVLPSPIQPVHHILASMTVNNIQENCQAKTMSLNNIFKLDKSISSNRRNPTFSRFSFQPCQRGREGPQGCHILRKGQKNWSPIWWKVKPKMSMRTIPHLISKTAIVGMFHHSHQLNCVVALP